MKSKFYDKIILAIEDSKEKQKQIRKELRIKNTGITEPLESEKFFSNYWPTTILENIASIRGRIGYHGLTRRDYRDTGPILLSVGNLSDDGKLIFKNTTHIHDKAFERSPNIIVEKNDILLSKSGTIGKICFIEEIKEKLTINAAINIFRCGELLLPKYLFYWFKSPATQSLLDKLAPGIAQRNLFQRELRRLSIPIPSLEFQHTLIIKIEELYSKIDSIQQSLEQTKLQLELYRQSLLKSVFSEFDKDSLSNISIINPAKPGRGEINDNLDVSFIPMKCVEEESGKIDLSNIRKFGDVKRGFTYFQDNDLIFAKITPCMENGKIAIVNNLKNGMGFGSTEFHVIRFEDEYSPKFYFWYLIQDIFRDTAQQQMKGTAGQKRVSTDYLKEVHVPVATIKEKKHAIQIIEEKMPLIQNTSQIVESTLQKLQTMKMSILKQAFEGKLIPQDPDDEPDSVLLERIKSTKDSQNTKQRRTKNVK